MKTMIETKNARIVGTMLGREDHGMFTFMIDLRYNGTGNCGSGQGAGGIDIGDKVGSICAPMIARILEVVGVMTWEELPGKPIRAKVEHMRVHAIGHYLEDRWLNFADFAHDQEQMR
jgi:hypothetical protein